MNETVRTLIVEDNPGDVDLIREMLTAGGPVSFEIESAPCLSEALARLAGGGIDVLLIDLGLPDSRGLETFRTLQEAAPDLPAIVLTGNDDEEAAITAVREGAQDYLIKGQIESSLLMRAVRYAVERNRVEAALHESESRYRMLFNRSADGILIADIDTRVFTYANPALCRMLGYTEKELTTMGVADIHPKDFLQSVVDEFEAQARGVKTLSSNIPCLRKDGTIFYADINTFSISLKGRMCNVGFFRDITERKKAEETLRESEEKYRSLVKAVVDPIIMMNMRGEVLLCNDAATVLFNNPESEILNQNVFELLPEKQASAWRETMVKVIASETPKALAHRHNERYFESIFAPVTDPEGRVFAVTVVARDLTDRKLDEEEIEKLARFPSENPNPVLRVANDGTLLYSNKLGELLLKEWKCRRGEALPEEWRARVAGIFRSGTVTDIEIECDDKVFSLILCPVAESEYINIYGIDITGSKNAEEALRQSEEQLRQGQKMEAVGRLAGGIAHDFNNLLTAITGFSDLTLAQLPEGSPLFDDIGTIKKAAFRAAALTRQLLAFSRQQALQPQILNLNETISNLDKMLRRIIGEDIEIVTRLAETIPRVKADPGQIEQVIMNLVVNARDAMPDGGTITVVTEKVSLDRDEAAIISEAHPGHFVRLSVEDTGTGIDPQVIEHIFEPFFTTKKVEEGTGLGLSTVYGIVKQHGGWINAYSEPGQGSVFKVYLPAFDVGTGWETDETGSREPPRGAGEKILVVEDEKGVRDFISRAFRQYGYVVLAADSIAEGEKIFNEHPGGIDLLFTDVLLTDGSGLRLAQQLRGRQPDLAILLCSGYSDGHFRWTAEDKETFRLLQKPCPLYDLLSAVKDALRERTEKKAKNDAVKKS